MSALILQPPLRGSHRLVTAQPTSCVIAPRSRERARSYFLGGEWQQDDADWSRRRRRAATVLVGSDSLRSPGT